MSNPSTATSQRVSADFAGNGLFLVAGAWIKVAGNFLVSFKADRHRFLRIRQIVRTRQRSAVDCYVGLLFFLREAKRPETATGSIQPQEVTIACKETS